MSGASTIKQLVMRMPTRVGLLAEVTTSIRAAGVNITAISAREQNGLAEFLLVTEDNQAATAAVAGLEADVSEETIVAVEMPNRVGALQEVAQRAADAGVNILYMYATAGSGDTATCVFRTEDDAAVVAAVNA